MLSSLMSLTKLLENRKIKNRKMRDYIEKSSTLYRSFFKEPYSYDDKEALEELGIESELIHELLEDFTIQLIQSNIHLHSKLNLLKKEEFCSKELDFSSFRDTIHKNLGVARNLRIKDSIEVLSKLIKESDLEKITMLLELLEACAIKLKPIKAYDTLQLIKKVS